MADPTHGSATATDTVPERKGSPLALLAADGSAAKVAMT